MTMEELDREIVVAPPTGGKVKRAK